MNGPSSQNAAFASWRGGRSLDVRTIFLGLTDWQHMIASGRALSHAIGNGTGRLVVAVGMLPKSHPHQTAQCASGAFDQQIQQVANAMLNNGARAAADAGRRVIIRLGWEANNIRGPYPWIATGDGIAWRNCFRRWVDFLNPVTDATTSPPTRRKNFLIVWNMANRGDFVHPIDNLWPGGQYVDIVGSQYYDRCPPLPEGDRFAFEARLDLRNYSNNPAGPRAWLEYAKSKGKKYAMPEWGIGGPHNICTEHGVDNPYFIEKMYEFFWKNAADIAFEAYFNGDAGSNPAQSHEIFSPDPAFPAPTSSDYRTYVERKNPRASAVYRQLWAGGLEPPPPPPPPEPPVPPAPPASDTLYWLRYVASYSDLIATIGADPVAARESFLATGEAQRRAAYFDPQGYMSIQPAIGTLVGNDPIEATRHYINIGYDRGIYTFSFGPQYWLRYIASHPELIPSLGDKASAGELHYYNTGQFERRTVTFDALAYLRANADVQALCGARNQTCATKHFINSR